MSGTNLARGVNKTIVMAQETTFGVLSTAAGQSLRRTNGQMNLSVSSIESQEILPSQQVRDWRQGPRQVTGTLSGQLSPGTYQMFFEGLLRSHFATGGTFGATSGSVVSSSGTTANVVGTSPQAFAAFNLASGSLLSDGFRSGDVVAFSGLVAPDTQYNGVPFQTAYVSSGSMYFTIGSTGLEGAPNQLPAWTAGSQTAITAAVVGKKCIIPATGQLNLSYSFEQWYSDVSISELFTGCVVTQISLNIPASGFVTFQASIIGQNSTSGGSQNYTSPTAPTTVAGLTAVSGLISYNGVALGYMTSMSLQIQSDVQADPAVGSDIVPFIFQGTLRVRGSLTCFMTNDVLPANFTNGTPVQISVLLSSNTGGAVGEPTPFINIFLPAVFLTSQMKTDSDRAIVRSYNFVAVEQTAGITGTYGYDDTSIVIQDSLAA